MLPYHLDSTQRQRRSASTARRTAGPTPRTPGTTAGWRQWPAVKDDRVDGLLQAAPSCRSSSRWPTPSRCATPTTARSQTGTNSNRLFLWTGTNGPTGAGVAARRQRVGRPSAAPTDAATRGPPIPSACRQAGVSWMVYQNMPDNFGDNSLAGFVQLPPGERGDRASRCARRLAVHGVRPSQRRRVNPLLQGHRQHDARRRVPGDVPGRRARRQAAAGVVDRRARDVLASTPARRARCRAPDYIRQVLDALTANPEVWSKTVLLVNFDENDGFFDHVPSAGGARPRRGRHAGRRRPRCATSTAERFTHPNPPGTTEPAASPTAARRTASARACRCIVISPWSRAAGSTRRCSTTPR